MSTIEVLSPGLLTTVQDLGRDGFGPLGVSPSGAADAVALRLGNRLVGNPESAAGLEMTLLGGTFLFPQGAVAALTGSDFGATLDNVPVSTWASFEATPAQTLRLGPTRSGARCYLCVQGGIAVKPFLNSSSTHLLSGLGGHEGRALRKGDVLQIGDTGLSTSVPSRKSVSPPRAGQAPPLPRVTRNEFISSSHNAAASHRQRRVSAKLLEQLAPRKNLRVTPGPQSNWFPEAAQKVFFEGTYRIAEESNRMGLRLEGPAIREGGHGEMISEGVSLGAIQIAAGGMPIILFVEQQTTGGYAKIANVISADLSSLGQLRPRDEIRFELVDFDTARKLFIEQEEMLASQDLIAEEGLVKRGTHRPPTR